jgi:hypothetical protein
MTRLTLLFLIAALAVPAAASAMPATDVGIAAPAQSLTAPDRDDGTRAALNNGVDVATASSAPEPVTSGHAGPSWFGALGIGIGLILIAGGLGVYAGRALRPRHLGA